MEAQALKQQVASRLQEHRHRRPRATDVQPTSQLQPTLPMEGLPTPLHSRVADSVAARFAKSVSYRDFLQQEAEAAVRQAEAAAEVAKRNAEAIATAQQQLLDDIGQWSAPAEIVAFELAAVEMEGNRKLGTSLRPEAASASVEAPASVAEPEIALPPPSLADRLQLQDGPVEPAVPIPANLIEFPRQLIAARKARPRFAEGPLREEADAAPERAQLRIFEVEASAVSTEPAMESVLPEWHNIRLEAQDDPRPAENRDAQTSLALPVYVAPVSLRLMATAVDGCCIGAAFLAAVTVAAYVSPVLPTGIPAAIAASGTLFLFALLYQMLFFTLNEATPGMRYARIGFCTFADENPSRASMCRRIFALLLAIVPLGLGVIWACLDEDGLAWHDRISRMYPREY